MGTKVESLPSWAGAWSRTPIWDEEFAERWEALMGEEPPAEPVKGKPRQKPATTTKRR
jgi:hypothetical protein